MNQVQFTLYHFVVINLHKQAQTDRHVVCCLVNNFWYDFIFSSLIHNTLKHKQNGYEKNRILFVLIRSH